MNRNMMSSSLQVQPSGDHAILSKIPQVTTTSMTLPGIAKHTARASFALYNTAEEVDALAAAVRRAQSLLG